MVHTSSRDAHEAIARARAAGKRVYGEPLIQHLVLDAERIPQPGLGPCGAAGDVAAVPGEGPSGELVGGPAIGLAPGGRDRPLRLHYRTEAARPHRLHQIPNGTGGLEDRLAVLWTAGVNTGRITMEEFVAVTSANAARILNIYPRKGTVAVGSDADLVIFDPDATKTVSAKTQVSRIDYNVFEGFACRGLPRATLARGKAVWLDGDLRAETGAGIMCRAQPSRPSRWRMRHGASSPRRGAWNASTLRPDGRRRGEDRMQNLQSTPSACGTR